MKRENGPMFSEDGEKTTLAELLAKMPENNWNWYLYDFEGIGIAPEGMDMQAFENLVVTQTYGYPFCWLSLKAFCSTLTDVRSCLLAAVKHPVDYELLESKEGSDVLALIRIDDSTAWEIKLSEVL